MGFIDKYKYAKQMAKFPSDSTIWGPGVWWIIHTLALQSNDQESIRKYIEIIEYILPRLPCMTCRNHAIEYLRNNRPEKYINFRDDSGELMGMFKWSWEFHNTVNDRLNKFPVGENPFSDYYVAKNLYDEDEFCTDDCGN